jgi:LacI family gluconate utilization system Gnt-II transcriptional activator
VISYNIDGIILSEKHHTVRTVKFLRSAKIPIVELMDVQGAKMDMWGLIIVRPPLTW